MRQEGNYLDRNADTRKLLMLVRQVDLFASEVRADLADANCELSATAREYAGDCILRRG